MKRLFVLSLLLSGLALAGVAYAYGTHYNSMQGPATDLTVNMPIRAAVMSVHGDSVRLFSPIGSGVLCKGDNLPIYRSPMSLFGNKTYDLKKMQLIGEVKVDKLSRGGNAEGRLIVGKAERGDIAAKPSESCLPSNG